MLDRMKQSLVDSYVGAIGLGWLFASGIQSFAISFSESIAGWIERSEYRGIMVTPPVTSFLLRDAVTNALRAFVLLLIGYILLRWLYYKPQEEGADSDAN